METVDFARFPEPGRPDPPPPVDRADIARAATLVNTAERPVLLVGAGVIGSGASPAVRRLAERAGIPVAATLLGLGVLPDEHPLFLGMVGMHAARATNLVLEECDLLIGLGIRFDDRATGKASEFCPRARARHRPERRARSSSRPRARRRREPRAPCPLVAGRRMAHTGGGAPLGIR
jgi:acetolactate synthase-1/2/3 large subunit